jgi:hypothetical protein
MYFVLFPDILLMLTVSPVGKFTKVIFQVILVHKWSEQVLSNGLNPLEIPQIHGDMEVDLTINKNLTGTFKTAHPSRIRSTTTNISSCFTEKICVKQVYHRRPNNAIQHYRGPKEFAKILKELICLDWANILLNLTYGFIKKAISKYGEPLGGILKLHFVHAMLAEVLEKHKYFLIEEWVGATGNFTKYINNGDPVSCVSVGARAAVHRIAEFLCFSQHVQYNETGGLAYTSDYQGLQFNQPFPNYSSLHRIG